MRDRGLRRLFRTLSLADLSVLASASMAPAYSLAAVMGLVVAAAATGAPLAVIVSTIPIAFIAVGFMHLSTQKPSAGGAYTWSRIAFGDRVGWFTAMLVIIAYYFGTMATAVPSGVYTLGTLSLFAPNFGASPLAIAVVGCLWIGFSAYFLFIGARPTARLSALFLAFELVALMLIAVIAFVHPFVGTPPPGHMPPGLGLGTTGISGLIVAAVLSIWISAGWEISTYSSEESTGTAETPGAGSLIGLLGTMALVWFCMRAFLRVGTVGGFTGHQEDALAYVAQRLGGGWIAVLMTATVLVSSAAALWTTMQLLSRAVFAMGRDGLLPRVLATVHPKYGSPYVAVLAISILASLVLLLSGFISSAQHTLSTVVSGSSIFLGATFIITGLACASLHTRQLAQQRHIFTGAVVPAVGAVWTLGFLIYNVWKQQEPLIQWLTAVGIVTAFIFAAMAGRWATAGKPMTLRREEEA